MQNHRRYEVKKGQIMPCHQRSAANRSGSSSQFPNIDSNSDEDMGKKNVGDRSDGSESEGSEAEDD